MLNLTNSAYIYIYPLKRSGTTCVFFKEKNVTIYELLET